MTIHSSGSRKIAGEYGTNKEIVGSDTRFVAMPKSTVEEEVRNDDEEEMHDEANIPLGPVVGS